MSSNSHSVLDAQKAYSDRSIDHSTDPRADNVKTPPQQSRSTCEEQQRIIQTAAATSVTSSEDSRPIMSNSSTYSKASSVQSFGGSTQSASQPLPEERRRSSITRVMDKAKAKFTGAERLPNDESEFERARAKEVEKQRRKEEYERLGLGDRTKFGGPGAGNWSM